MRQSAVGAARFRPAAWSIERVISVVFAVAVVAIAASAMLVWRSLHQFLDSSRSISHTYLVLGTTDRVFASLNEATAHVREYVITEDRSLLARRDSAIRQLSAGIQDLRAMTADNPDQKRHLAELEKLVTLRVELINALPVARDAQGFDAARNSIVSGVGAGLTEKIRATLDDMANTERALLIQRTTRDQGNARRLLLSTAGLLTAIGIALLFAYSLVRKELAARRQITAELDDSRRFFESVFDNIPNMVFIKDAQTLRYVAFNSAAEKMAGVKRENVVGKTDRDLFPREQAERLAETERRILDTGEPVDIPAERLRIRAREDRILHTRKTIIAHEDGQPLYLLGISEDVTDRVSAEENIRALNAHLGEQTHALEAVNRELESFCYSVSHDLRAPLRAVNSYALMLEEDYSALLPDEARRFMRVIRDGANRMGCLIEDLLEFSRLGRTPVKMQRVDMSSAVSRAVQEALEDAENARPEVVLRELPDAEADPALLHQVWSNLVGNAIKYSRKAVAPRVEIGSRTNGSAIVYYVSDNGAGFDMRYVDKLFGVFQRLHGQEEFPGTGVGLAIVQRVVTRHGGRVWAESEPGKGATFSFTLTKGEPG